MSAVMQAMKSFLEEEGWVHEMHEQGDAVRMRFRGSSGEWPLFAQEVGGGGKLLVYGLPDTPIPLERRVAVAETVCRLNWGLIVGNFEFDVDTGEVRFKTSADLRGVEPTVATMRHLVFTNCLMLDRYLPPLLAVAFGKTDPKTAVESVS
jgi:hypothetical protein